MSLSWVSPKTDSSYLLLIYLQVKLNLSVFICKIMAFIYVLTTVWVVVKRSKTVHVKKL